MVDRNKDAVIEGLSMTTREPYEEFIDIVYRGLLGRHVDPDGLATYGRFIHDHRNLDALVEMIESIAGSEEAVRYRRRLADAVQRQPGSYHYS
jgi:hypothetical protein